MAKKYKQLPHEQSKKFKEIYKSGKTHANIKESFNNTKKETASIPHQ